MEKNFDRKVEIKEGNKYEFDRQFLERKTIISPWGDIEVVDIAPEKEKTETPVLFAPGWSITIDTLEEPLRYLVKNNRRVLTLNHPRVGGDVQKNIEYPPEEFRKALSLLEVLKEKRIEKVDLIGYSEGGVNSAIVAKIAPDKINNMVLMNPAGMIDNNFLKLSSRFSAELLKMAKKNITGKNQDINRFLLGVFKYLKQNPARALKEVSEMASMDIRDILKDCREQGMGVSVVHGVDDTVFPMDDFQSNVKGEGVDGFYSVKGDHAEFFRQPKVYMDLVDKAFTDLQNKKDNN